MILFDFGLLLATTTSKPVAYVDLVHYIIFYGLLLMAVVQYLPLKFLKKNDRLCGWVKPRMFGIAYMVGFEVVFASATCMAALGRSIELVTILAFPLVGQSYQLAKVLSTCLRYDNYEEIIYKTFGRKKTIRMSEVRFAHREMRKGYLGYVLVLGLPDGSEISLAQMHYVGLEDLWEIFNPY